MATELYDIIDTECTGHRIPQLTLEDTEFSALRGELRTADGLPLPTSVKRMLVQLRDGRTLTIRSELDPEPWVGPS